MSSTATTCETMPICTSSRLLKNPSLIAKEAAKERPGDLWRQGASGATSYSSVVWNAPRTFHNHPAQRAGLPLYHR